MAETRSDKPLKLPRSVLVVIYTAARETLLIERADMAGFWQSVTGSQEDGESFSQTAVRELQEETGFDAAQFGGVVDLQCENVFSIYPRWRHRYPPGTTHNRERCFAARLPEKLTPKLAPREHVAYEWMPIARAIERVTSWSNAAALQALFTRYLPMSGNVSNVQLFGCSPDSIGARMNNFVNSTLALSSPQPQSKKHFQ